LNKNYIELSDEIILNLLAEEKFSLKEIKSLKRSGAKWDIETQKPILLIKNVFKNNEKQ
jgi:hypothetical protein